MIKAKPHLYLFTKAAFLLSCLFVWGCENSQRSLNEWQEKRVSVEEGKDIQLLISQGGTMKSKLTAPLMIRQSAFDTVFVEFPQSLRMVFFDSTKMEQSRMDAKYGKFFESLKKAYMRDSVVVASTTGDTLWTEELWWDQEAQVFYTDKKIKIFRRGDRIYGGKGLRAKQNLTDVIIYQVEQPSRVAVADSMAAK